MAILAADADFHDELAKPSSRTSPGARDLFAADDDAARAAAQLNAALQVAYFIHGRARGRSGRRPDDRRSTPAGVDREFFPDGRHRALVVVNIGKPGRERLVRPPAAPGLRRGRHLRLSPRRDLSNPLSETVPIRAPPD